MRKSNLGIAVLFCICWIVAAAAHAATAMNHGASMVSADRYLRPQQRVQVEAGRTINLFCMGHGAPVVLLNAGLGDSSLSWRQVQGTLSKNTRVCAFDRAGYGFSDPARRPSTVQSAVDDMVALIDEADLGSPIVLVAHSLGGMQALLFALEKPQRLAGLVLVDPSYPGQPRRGSEADQIDSIGACLDAAEAGILAQEDPPVSVRHCLDYPENPDPELHRELNRQYARPQTYATMLSEARSLHMLDGNGQSEDERILRAHWHGLGALPLVVLSAGTVWPASDLMTAADARIKWAQHIEGHRRIAALSTRGHAIVVADTTHYIQKLQPRAVVRAVEKVVADARGDASR